MLMLMTRMPSSKDIATNSKGTPFKSGTEEFINHLLTSYTERSEVVARVRQAAYLRCVDDPVWALVWSTLLRFGAEILLKVVGRQYHEDHTLHFPKPEERKLTRLGIWYIKRAGASVEEMLKSDNWEEFRREGHMIMLRLFRILPAR